MDETEEKLTKKLNGLSNGISSENITTLDLSHRNINNIEHVKLPSNLLELNISHNKLDIVLDIITNLKNLKLLDISHNNIRYFDDTPSFCHVIENLNISNNKLCSPPAWIWFVFPKKLTTLDISSNIFLTESFQCGYFEELLQYKTSIKDITIYNCRLHNYIDLFATFSKAKNIIAGRDDINYLGANRIVDFPCKGFTECCDIEQLNLSYTQLFNVKPNIDLYKHLKEINLSHNEISGLPNEFCKLVCLEVCILSFNRILYLPDDFANLKKLEKLSVDSNKLCMLPEKLCDLPKLKNLDLYDNYLCELPVDLTRIVEIDVAQNYVEEPLDEEYINKREQLRNNIRGRCSGRKFETVRPDSSAPSCTSIDEEFDLQSESSSSLNEDIPINADHPPSSPEDWDSDDYWVPYYFRHTTPPQSPWMYFVKQKMEEGNFCPIDAHIVSVAEKVKYEKMCNPQVQYESDGQFDDYSSDDS